MDHLIKNYCEQKLDTLIGDDVISIVTFEKINYCTKKLHNIIVLTSIYM